MHKNYYVHCYKKQSPHHQWTTCTADLASLLSDETRLKHLFSPWTTTSYLSIVTIHYSKKTRGLIPVFALKFWKNWDWNFLIFCTTTPGDLNPSQILSVLKFCLLYWMENIYSFSIWYNGYTTLFLWEQCILEPRLGSS